MVGNLMTLRRPSQRPCQMERELSMLEGIGTLMTKMETDRASELGHCCNCGQSITHKRLARLSRLEISTQDKPAGSH